MAFSIFFTFMIALSSPASAWQWPWWPNKKTNTEACDSSLARGQEILDRVVVAPEQEASKGERHYVLAAAGFISATSGQVGFFVGTLQHAGQTHAEIALVARSIEHLRANVEDGIHRSGNLATYPYTAWSHGLSVDVVETSSGQRLIVLTQKVGAGSDSQIIGRLAPQLEDGHVFDGSNYRVYRDADRFKLMFALSSNGDPLPLQLLLDLEMLHLNRPVLDPESRP